MEIVQKTQQLLTLNTSTASLQRLANGKLALTYLSIGDIDSGVTVAYYVDDANRLQSMDITGLEQRQASSPAMEVIPVELAEQMIETQFSSLNDVASPEQLQRVRDKTQHYRYKKEMRRDYDSNKLHYLYTEGFSEFLGIREDKWEAMIPLEVIDEPIRSLLTKRAMNRSKGIRMRTDQDKAELGQIMVWFDGWHKKYGKFQGMGAKIRAMSAEERQKVLGSIGIPGSQ